MKAVLLGLIVAVMLVMIGTIPVFAHEKIHNTVGAGLEIKNLEAPVEKLTSVNFPKWLSLNGEIKKPIATNAFYDSFAGVEDDLGAEAWLFVTVDLNTEK